MGKNLFKSGKTAAKTVAKVGGKGVKEGVKISESVAKSKGKHALRSVKGVVTEAIGEEIVDSRGTRLTNPTGGEFVVNKESRVLYSYFAIFLTGFLLVLAFGELIFAIISYSILRGYQKLFGDFYEVGYIPWNMFLTFIFISIFSSFGFWIVWKYKETEQLEEDEYTDMRAFAIAIKRSIAWIKLVFYAAIILSIALIALIVYCSMNLSDLDSKMPQIVTKTMRKYTTNLESKSEIDRIQLQFDCCGSGGYEDWFKISLYGDINGEHFQWYKSRFGSKISNSVLQNNTYNKDRKWFGNDVPFSCCLKKTSNRCLFNDVNNKLKLNSDYDENLLTIHMKGCSDKLKSSLTTLKNWIQSYRLTELSALFIYMTLIQIIYGSLHSQYDENTTPPTARLPILCIIVMVIILVCLYFLTFTSS
jgi:hypothetical protein